MSETKVLFTDADSNIHCVEFKSNLNKLPKHRPVNLPSNLCTFGDLHGNAAKFLHLLVERGVLELNDHDLQEILNIYKKGNLEKNDLERFSQILQTARFNRHTDLCLIGDELADRGKNDIFTLLILKELKEKNVKFEITISNHSIEFLRNFENQTLDDPLKIKTKRANKPGETVSMSKMAQLVKDGKIDQESINQLVRDYYLPNLKLLTYRISEDGQSITVFSHARINTDAIIKTANELGVPYKAETPQALAETIDKINRKFEIYKTNSILKSQGHPFTKTVSDLNRPKNFMNDLIWNRENVLTPGALPASLTDLPYKVNFVHGHEKKKAPSEIYSPDKNARVDSIDDSFGKKDNTIGRYKVFLARGSLLKDLHKELDEFIASKQELIDVPINELKTVSDVEITLSDLQPIKEKLLKISEEASIRNIDRLDEFRLKINGKLNEISLREKALQQQKLQLQIESILIPMEEEFSHFTSLEDLKKTLDNHSEKLSSFKKELENFNLPQIKQKIEKKQNSLNKRLERVKLLQDWFDKKTAYLNEINIPQVVTNELFSGKELPNIQKEETELSRLKERLDKLVLPEKEDQLLNHQITAKKEEIAALYKKLEEHNKLFENLTQEISKTRELPDPLKNIKSYIDVQNGEPKLREKLATLARIKENLDHQELCPAAKKTLHTEATQAEKLLREFLTQAYNKEISKLGHFQLPPVEAFNVEGFNKTLFDYLGDLNNKRIQLEARRDEWKDSLNEETKQQILAAQQRLEQLSTEALNLFSTNVIQRIAEIPESLKNTHSYDDVQTGEPELREKLTTLARIKEDLNRRDEPSPGVKEKLNDKITQAEKSLQEFLTQAYNEEITNLEQFKLPLAEEFTMEAFNQALAHYLEDLNNKRIQLEARRDEWKDSLSEETKQQILAAQQRLEQLSTEAKVFASALKASLNDLTDLLNTIQSREYAQLNSEILNSTTKFINTMRSSEATPEQKIEAADEYQAMIEKIPTFPEEALDKGSREKLASTLLTIFGIVALTLALLAGTALVIMAIAALPAVAIGAGVAGFIAATSTTITALGISTTALSVTAAASAVTGAALLTTGGFFSVKSSNKENDARLKQEEYDQYGKVKDKTEHIKEVLGPKK